MIRRVLAGALALTGLLAAPPASAALCREIAFEGARYTICDIAPAEEALRLYLSAPSGRPYGQFGALEAARGPMAFAMNAGMYHADRRPVGLYIEDGVELAPLVTSAGPGNFGLLPNGVLCLSDDRARVIETRAYEADPPECRFATQSGPMLVIDGALHPRFIPDSPSRHVRNGVGTSADGRRAVFAISARPVSFHAFARLFRDGLGLPNALYLDGSISRLHAPALGRSDPGARMGPIVAVPAR